MNAALNIARTLNISCKRYISSVKLPSEIVIPMNKDIIICWHPERKFPYEYSLPLPEEKEISSNSVLCIGGKEIAEVFKHKREEVVIEELSKMTFTTKHRWYPKKKLYKYRKVEPDRPYL
ncbi:39S ribosomal protein L42, mitochondrial [Habropoda laboriosa]|uniref:Large ribosomal subunit protein mL42 n=1 Tax=Habropoda laboriosa TaxID=597456 RepID=A0A0L7R7D1_9HYME|nr:PREDICTED: 39S ribosomal protein L42, mitochondrial [Habropoda laboriosa]KOC66749.1 39S ribosomal protein L42, mitochondrial [Habropoda laboriosa]